MSDICQTPQLLILSITNVARTFVDVLDRIELSGGWEEVVRSISNIAILNIDDVVTYCLLLNNRILAAKVGFFLEQRQGAFSVNPEQINVLLKLKPVSPQYLTDSTQPSQWVKKWNLMVPLQILNQGWEELNDNY